MVLSILFGLLRSFQLWVRYKSNIPIYDGVVDDEGKAAAMPPAFTITSTVGAMAALVVTPLGFIAWGVRALFF
jgi:hypothetical protein